MSLQRRVIFHIGQTKAGSTSIQNYLESQRDALLAKGILFPQSVMSRSNPFDQSRTAGHLPLLRGLRGDGIIKAFERELETHPHHTLILSIENMFFDRPDSDLELVGQYFCRDKLEVFSILRPQFDWLRSRYIENILSGFISRVETFSDFVQNIVEAGLLNYHTRIRHVAGLMGASEIRAIPFASDEAPLVTRFLQIASLPLTNPDAAVSQHSNVREKSIALVEGKRRLNMVCSDLSASVRLEIEHSFRQIYATSFSAREEIEFSPDVLLSNDQVTELRLANRALADDGIAAQPLGLGQAGSGGVADPLTVNELLRQGLRASALICECHRQPGKLQESLLRFDAKECDALSQALGRATASTHLQSPETALLAACFDRRLVRLHLIPDRNFWRHMLRFDALMSPSPLIARDINITQETVDPSPEVLVVGEGSELAPVQFLLDQTALRQIILLEGARSLLRDLHLVSWQRHDVGRCLFLERRD